MIFFLGNIGLRSRSQGSYEITPTVKHDLRTVACIIEMTRRKPLPILDKGDIVTSNSIVVYTDASGHLLDNPSLGIFVPKQNRSAPLVCSLAFPRFFLLRTDEAQKKVFCKTTSLECLGYLSALCMDPLRFTGCRVVFMIDNQASVIALRKGYSKGDPWATTLVRAAKVVAAGIGADISSAWEPRRSSRGSRIADDLTHNLVKELEDEEISSFLGSKTRFPEPILGWMACAGPDQGLGLRCLRWIRKMNENIVLFKPNDV